MSTNNKNKSISVSSFNCKNTCSSGNDITELCKRSDIIMLQEMWLMEFELPMLNNLHKYFYAKGLSAMSVYDDMHVDLAIKWRKDLPQIFSIVEYMMTAEYLV